ncbi:AraC family transcriptional regulator [Pleomorphomonas oryzae]|uniref:AraC family transcriptional regulator n=1 Tax=Pleomorphomonas oryzae TaxID=261934 RepID=UPI00047B9846|nr:AraC family transcriptional regulator [Pleomorphomonas oryzae]
MTDPLAEVVTLLQPSASFSKLVEAAGAWRVRRVEEGRPFYAAILEGSCLLTVDGQPPIVVEKGDFVLIPSVNDFSTSSVEPPPEGVVTLPLEIGPRRFRLGRPDGPTDARMAIGYCTFRSADADLLLSLLPRFIHVRGEPRLATLVELVDEEARAVRPARDVILTHLLEVLLIEALRAIGRSSPTPGLINGLADERLAVALRRLHEDPTRTWTVPELAREAGLSRSVFFERFRRVVGLSPMDYLLAWRMALAKDLLRREEAGVAEVAERVGYASASTFTIAFSRHVGVPPARYARGI